MRQIKCFLMILMFVGCTNISGLTMGDYNKINERLLVYSAVGNSIKVKELIERGAHINVRNKYGETPLHIAIRNNHKNIAIILIDMGGDITAPDPLGDTPLHISVHEKQSDISNLLRQKGANENCLNMFGLRPKEMASLPQIEEKIITIANLMDTNGTWKDINKARKGSELCDDLKNINDRRYVINALVLQATNPDNRNIRLQISFLAVKLEIVKHNDLASFRKVMVNKSLFSKNFIMETK